MKTKLTIGEIVERLIFIKDNYGIEDLGDLDAINEACNILDHNFHRFSTSNELIDEHITSIHWRYDDIMSELADNGFEPNEENVAIIVGYPGLAKYLQERSTDAGWAVMRGVISELKDKLLVLQSDSKEE